MLCYICYITNMSRGNSGRIVLEVEPSRKRDLYSALDLDGMTLKDWFLNQVERYLEERNQMKLFKEESITTKDRERK